MSTIEYRDLRKRNRRRLIIAIILLVIVILVFLLVIINKKKTVTPKKEVVISINGDVQGKSSNQISGTNNDILLKDNNTRSIVVADKVNQDAKNILNKKAGESNEYILKNAGSNIVKKIDNPIIFSKIELDKANANKLEDSFVKNKKLANQKLVPISKEQDKTGSNIKNKTIISQTNKNNSGIDKKSTINKNNNSVNNTKIDNSKRIGKASTKNNTSKDNKTKNNNVSVNKKTTISSSGKNVNKNSKKIDNSINNSIIIQAGAFYNKTQAQNRLKLLQKLNIKNVKLYEVKLAKNTLYRVRIGPISNQANIKSILDKMKKQGIEWIIIGE